MGWNKGFSPINNLYKGCSLLTVLKASVWRGKKLKDTTLTYIPKIQTVRAFGPVRSFSIVNPMVRQLKARLYSSELPYSCIAHYLHPSRVEYVELHQRGQFCTFSEGEGALLRNVQKNPYKSFIIFCTFPLDSVRILHESGGGEGGGRWALTRTELQKSPCRRSKPSAGARSKPA